MTTDTKISIEVDLGPRSYEITIGKGWINGLGADLSNSFGENRFVIVTNPEIDALHGARLLEMLRAAGLAAETLTIPEGESAKTLETVSKIYDFLIERKYGRQTTLVALGGGVVGDIVGFAADSFLRGVGLVQVPTTLLAMVDSSVGGKTGVNHRLGKNLIGAFKQPDRVAIELDFLQTLPEEEFRSGLAEVVKYGMIRDAEFFDYLEANVGRIIGRETDALTRIIRRSCEIKADVVSQDETEAGVRMILNLGHTFGHAVEMLTNYRGIRHGEGVAMGMMAACRLAERVADFPGESTKRLGDLLEKLGLPVLLERFEVEKYLGAMASDKKVRSGSVRFVIPERIGTVVIRDDIEDAEVVSALEASFGGTE